MGTDVQLVLATLAHADALAPLLRPADVAECEALGLEPRSALHDALAKSDLALTAFFDGEVAAIAGVVPGLSPGEGVLWMLSGKAVDRHRKAFLRASREVLERFRGRYELLFNVIDARYTAALRWARWLGLDVRPAQPFGPKGELFHPFYLRRAA